VLILNFSREKDSLKFAGAVDIQGQHQLNYREKLLVQATLAEKHAAAFKGEQNLRV
jgi:hypothetical protein